MKNIVVAMIVLALLLTSFSSAFAVDKKKNALARELMTLTDVPEMMQKVFDSVSRSHLEKLAEVDYPEKSDKKDAVLTQRVTDYLDTALQWQRFEQGYADVYTAFFTEDELRQAVDFYRSSVARKLIGNDMALKTLLLESTQLQMRDMAIKVKQIENSFIKEQVK